MARSFSTLFSRPRKARQDPARGLEPGRARRLRQARRRVAPGGGQARRQCLARRRLALAGPGPLGGLAPVHRRPGPASRLRPLHSARRAAPGHAAGGHAARLSPDRAVVRAGFAHEPVGRRGRLHGAVPAAVHGPAGAALLALVPARRAARRRRGRPDRRAGPLGSGASWPGSDARVHRRPVGGRRHGGSCGAAASATGGGAGHAFRPGDGRRAQRRRGPANHAPGRAQALRPLLESVANPAALRLGMPAIILQGQLDPAVAPRNARQLFDQFRLLNGLHPRMFRSSAYWGWARTNPIAGSTC